MSNNPSSLINRGLIQSTATMVLIGSRNEGIMASLLSLVIALIV